MRPIRHDPLGGQKGGAMEYNKPIADMCPGMDVEGFYILRAAALKNLMGLVCDPVAGLVEVPCVKRNVIGAVNAVSAADMALAGIESRIPVDEVIDAMGEVGRRMPVEFRETALGGLAATPTGERLKRELTAKREK